MENYLLTLAFSSSSLSISEVGIGEKVLPGGWDQELGRCFSFFPIYKGFKFLRIFANFIQSKIFLVRGIVSLGDKLFRASYLFEFIALHVLLVICVDLDIPLSLDLMWIY